jgi:hypothetical protein
MPPAGLNHLGSFELLSAQDVQSAGLLAQKLDDQNRERQRLTQKCKRKRKLNLTASILIRF